MSNKNEYDINLVKVIDVDIDLGFSYSCVKRNDLLFSASA